MNSNQISSATAKSQQQKSKKSKPQKNGQKKQSPASAPSMAPVAYRSEQKTIAPVVTNNGISCRVRHRELVGNVTGSVAFAATAYALNPGIPASFPWLSVMASAWEEYHFNSLEYHYCTRVSTSTPGSLLLAPDYDAIDSAPVTEPIMSSYQDCVSAVPWIPDLRCRLRPDSLASGMAKKYIRVGPLPSNADLKTYDSGNLFVGAVDGTAVAWGKLWVEYDVTFFVPSLVSSGVPYAGGIVTGANTLTAVNPFGVAPTIDAQSIGITMDAGSVATVAFPGTYFFRLLVGGTNLTVVTAPTLGAGSAVGISSSTINAAATSGQYTAVLVTTIPNTLLTFNTVSVAATTVTSSSLVWAVGPANAYA